MVVRAKHAALHKAEESFDRVGRDMPSVLVSSIFLVLVRHHVMIREVIVQKVIVDPLTWFVKVIIPKARIQLHTTARKEWIGAGELEGSEK